jgi:apolipoprotein N-acyltransferase
MAGVSRIILPIFFESVIISISEAVFLMINGFRKKTIIFQIALITALSIVLSSGYRILTQKPVKTPAFAAGFVQLSYSSNDYNLTDNYPGFAEKINNAYLEYAKKVQSCRLLVLPESSFPYKNGDHLYSLQLLAKEKNEYILTAYILKENDKLYNSILLINPEGQIQDKYIKQNTVPVTESNFISGGGEMHNFKIDGFNIAPLICYDTVFFLSYFRRKDADLLLAVTNDVFAEGTSLGRLHQCYAIFYSRMTGRPFLQITQNGPSFYVSKTGRLQILASLNEISYKFRMSGF